MGHTHARQGNQTMSQRQNQMVGVTETFEQEVDYLGHVCWATTGNVIVPREWLVEQFESIPGGESLIPNKKWPSSAYKLACHNLIDASNREMSINGRGVTFRVVDGDSGNYKHLFADVMIPERESGVDGGEIETHKLSTYDYDADTSNPKVYHKVSEEKEALFRQAVIKKSRLMELWETMKESHNGQDLRGVFLDLRDEETNAVPLRHAGAVYFFPAQYSQTVQGLAQVWERLNQFKDVGHPMEIATIPLIDNEGHRELVERHAERIIQKRIDDVVVERMDELDENDDETAQTIAEDIMDDLDDTLDLAEEYSSLLETRLTIKRHLRSWMDDVEGEKDEVIQKLLDTDSMEV